MADPVVAHDGQVYDHGEDKKSGQPTSEALQAKSRQQPSEEPTADNHRKERTADTITTFFALAAIRLILARATDRVAGPAHRRVVEDRGCRVAGPASRAEAAAGSRYLVLVDKLSQSLQDRCLLLLSLAALATSSMQ